MSATVMINGQEVTVPRLKFGVTMKLIAMVKRHVKALGLDPEELKKREISGLSDILGILQDVIGKAFDDYDIDNDRPGPVLADFLGILQTLTGLDRTTIWEAELSELHAFIFTLMEQEAESGMGKSLGAMILPITSLLSDAIGMARARLTTATLLASAGGLISGGETSSYTPSVESTESFPETSTTSTLENSLVSSNP
jgi:hypothetical protein